MGQAICAGLLCIDGIAPSFVTVANPGAEKRSLIAAKYGVCTVEENPYALPADTVILAVKPAKAVEVMRELTEAGFEGGIVISVAAGVSTATLAQVVADDVQIVRVMPNTPLTVGAGMCAISGAENVTEATLDMVYDLFSTMGSAVIIPEELQDAATAISGSGPAYFEFFVRSMQQAGIDLGLEEGVALKLALQTMRGTAEMLATTNQDLDEAIAQVSSPGGTTVAALDAMREAAVDQGIIAGVNAAAARSKELGA